MRGVENYPLGAYRSGSVDRSLLSANGARWAPRITKGHPMNPHLIQAVAQSRQQDLVREVQHTTPAAIDA